MNKQVDREKIEEIKKIEENKKEGDKIIIKIDNFEGPLDLLIYLIDKNKIEIAHVNISEIANQYIHYLEKMKELDLDIASEFLIMASDLIYLKSKSLLPKEEDQEELTEQEFILKLLKYKQYKMIQEQFKNMMLENSKKMTKEPSKIILKNMKFEKRYSVKEIQDAYNKILLRLKLTNNRKIEVYEKVANRKNFSIFSKVREIYKILYKNAKFNFNKIFSKKERSKNEIITAFLSILELTKKSKINISQEERYSDIIVEKNRVKKEKTNEN